MKNFSYNQSDCLSVGFALKVIFLSTIVQLAPIGALKAQPLSREAPVARVPDHTRMASHTAATFAGDPFTKITEGDVVNDGSVASSTGCSWADYDNDDDLDLYACNYGSNNFFYVNNGDRTFTKITTIHIIHPGNSNSGNWADYDNDGDLDLIVANDGVNYDMESWFTNNDGGSFTQIVIGPLANDGGGSQGICWADYDNDGYLDLFIPNGFFFAPENNSLYHNNGDGSFTKITTGDIVSNGGTSLTAGWNDYDNDGDVDLLVTNPGTEDNFFYINNGDGSFTRDLSISIIQDGASSYGSAWGDYDNDGDADLYIACLGNDALFRNSGNGTFTQDTSSVIAHDVRNSLSGGWGDYDNDGDLDLFVANGGDEDNFLYKNNGDGTFTKDSSSIVTNDGGNSQSLAWADYDNDGALDLFVSNSLENNFLYRNNGNENAWINILLVGTVSNTSGIGAKVRAKATINGAPVWQLREIEGQSGFRSQNSLNVEFGFGDATIIDSLRVEWPSGILDVLTIVGVNQFITVTEGQAIPAVGEGKNNLPHEFDLQQNYPNPFNPSTKIKYSVPNTSHVTLKVYNMLGQEVATLVNEQQNAGDHGVEFSVAGQATGAYFYKLEAGSFKETKKFVLLK